MVVTTLLALVAALSALTCADTPCNPLQGSCAPIPGMPSKTYSVDFMQATSIPDEWISADYETTTFGPQGAVFTFNQRYDAPYIWTQFYVMFGHIEVVMQAAPGVGIISSAVMMSDDADEIDWEFSGNNFGNDHGTIQTNYFGKGITSTYDHGTQPACSDPSSQLHTYTLDWSSSELVWSVDGAPIRTLTNNNGHSANDQYPQTPSRLHLGIWDGGDPSNAAGTIAWAGGVTNTSLAPFTAYVKSVKIIPAQPCAAYQYTDTSGSWQDITCIASTSALSTTSTSTAIASSVVSTVGLTSVTDSTAASSTIAPTTQPGSSTPTASTINSTSGSSRSSSPSSSPSTCTSSTSSASTISTISTSGSSSSSSSSSSSISSTSRIGSSSRSTIAIATAAAAATAATTANLPTTLSKITVPWNKPTPSTTTSSHPIPSKPAPNCNSDQIQNPCLHALSSTNLPANKGFCAAYLSFPLSTLNLPDHLTTTCQGRGQMAAEQVREACSCLMAPPASSSHSNSSPSKTTTPVGWNMPGESSWPTKGWK